MTTDPRFSLVVPVHDEEDNIVPLLDEVADVLAPQGRFEAILVDDGSTDASVERARRWKAEHDAPWLRIVCLGRRRGQSAAVLVGAQRATAPRLLIMDGDLQNDPRDFARMLAMVESGEWQAVTGIRKRRRDSFVRRLSSRIGNAVRNRLTGDRVHDAACGIKVFERELFLRLPRFDGMHRFMVTLARHAGARAAEVEVNHRPRPAGRAKYGVADRALRGLADCLVVRWYRRRWLDDSVREEV